MFFGGIGGYDANGYGEKDNGRIPMHGRGGFVVDIVLLEIAKLRWYVRYPVAACVLYASWWLLEASYPKIGLHAYWFPSIFAICAMIMIKEISPSLLLIAGSIWLWPSGFFDTPFAQMTFGILFRFAGSVVLFALGLFSGIVIYSRTQNTIAPEVKRRQELGYDK